MLGIIEFGDGQSRALGENVLGQFEPHVNAAEHDPRKQPRNQHSGKQAGQNHEQ